MVDIFYHYFDVRLNLILQEGDMTQEKSDKQKSDKQLMDYQAPSMEKHDPVKVVQGTGETYYYTYTYTYYYYYY